MNITLRYSSGRYVDCRMKHGSTFSISKYEYGYGVMVRPFAPAKTGNQLNSGLIEVAILHLSNQEAIALAQAIISMSHGGINANREFRFGLADGVQGPEPDASLT